MKRFLQQFPVHRSLQKILKTFFPAHIQQFVPGEQINDFVVRLQEHTHAGYGSILHPIQISEQRVAEPYLDAVASVAYHGLLGSVALRLPMENINEIVAFARAHDVRLEFDMRHAATVDATLDFYKEVNAVHSSTVLCLQANLKRTEKDIGDLLGRGPHIRLVKGAFKENPRIAYTSPEDIAQNYVALAQYLLQQPRLPISFATHDEALLSVLLAQIEKKRIDKRRVAFQMLYGVREDLQRHLHDVGYAVWQYMSYGRDWLPYFVDRLFERKENLSFLKTVVRL